MKTAPRLLQPVDWNNLPLLLGEKDAAVITGLSLSFFRKSRCEGTRGKGMPAPPFVSIGGRRYYKAADLRSWVEELPAREHI